MLQSEQLADLRTAVQSSESGRNAGHDGATAFDTDRRDFDWGVCAIAGRHHFYGCDFGCGDDDRDGVECAVDGTGL